MNKHGMLILCLIAVSSICNKSKHAHILCKNKANFTVVTQVLVSDIRFFLPKYQNIRHWKVYANCLTVIIFFSFNYLLCHLSFSELLQFLFLLDVNRTEFYNYHHYVPVFLIRQENNIIYRRQ